MEPGRLLCAASPGWTWPWLSRDCVASPCGGSASMPRGGCTGCISSISMPGGAPIRRGCSDRKWAARMRFVWAGADSASAGSTNVFFTTYLLGPMVGRGFAARPWAARALASGGSCGAGCVGGVAPKGPLRSTLASRCSMNGLCPPQGSLSAEGVAKFAPPPTWPMDGCCWMLQPSGGWGPPRGAPPQGLPKGGPSEVMSAAGPSGGASSAKEPPVTNLAGLRVWYGPCPPPPR
mmetsp:Transcript_47184/g.140835  ORF Transcript_47184/g.140835 Transcript_47184/m.140835 type:complete len:234 (+) Transcript_47184:546-1247(+)